MVETVNFITKLCFRDSEHDVLLNSIRDLNCSILSLAYDMILK